MTAVSMDTAEEAQKALLRMGFEDPRARASVFGLLTSSDDHARRELVRIANDPNPCFQKVATTVLEIEEELNALFNANRKAIVAWLEEKKSGLGDDIPKAIISAGDPARVEAFLRKILG